MTVYRCQGCREYHRDVYRRIGLGSVCSPECETTVRTRPRGGTNPRPVHDRWTGSAQEPAAASGETGDVPPPPQAASGDTGDQRSLSVGPSEVVAASGETDDVAPAEPTASGKADDKQLVVTGDITGFCSQRDGTDHDDPPATGPRRVTSVTSNQYQTSVMADHDPDDLSRTDHDSKKILREGTLATVRRTSATTSARGTARSRDWQPSKPVLERDRRCRYCGTARNLHIHHIDYRSQGGNDDPHNLIVLCHEHHGLVHSDKAVWQPLLRAYIWLFYFEGRQLFLLDIKRLYATQSCSRHDSPGRARLT
jgi:hypothetical protein